ncbi:MAG: pyrroline-5-carboxylate reductase [Erysipelothrix sp.]
MKIGFIGIGNMASAIIEGISDKKSVYISSSTPERTLEKANVLGVNATKNNRNLVEQVDIIILCVKPEMLEAVSNEIKDLIGTKICVSIAAKKTIKDLENYLGLVPIVRVMPNLNATIKQSTSAITRNNRVSNENYELVNNIFKNVGAVFEVEENLFSAFIGIAGSSPAFIFKFIDSLMNQAVKEGMDFDEALAITVSAVKGSADFLQQSSNTAQELVVKVCSPGGTTIEGVQSLDKNNFDQIVNEAVAATIKKDKLG